MRVCAAPRDERRPWLGCCGEPGVAEQVDVVFLRTPGAERPRPHVVRRAKCAGHRVDVRRAPRAVVPWEFLKRVGVW